MDGNVTLGDAGTDTITLTGKVGTITLANAETIDNATDGTIDFGAANLAATGTLTGLTGLTVASGTVSLPAGAIGTSALANDSVDIDKLDYEVVAVTVALGATSGTGTCTSGSIILGYYPTGNQDQLVDNVAVSTTTVTVTLAAAATADNTFNVVMLKP